MLNDLIHIEFPVMDIEYDRNLTELNSSIEKTLKETQGLCISGPDDVFTLSHYLKIYKHFTKKGEEIRKKCVEPFNTCVKDINGFFKKIYNRYSVEEKRLENELLEFNRKQIELAALLEKERRSKIEEAALQKAIEVEERKKVEAALNGNRPEEMIPVEIPDVNYRERSVPRLSAANISGISSARIKRWKITCFDEIPKNFLCVNEALINNLRKEYDFEDASPVPGIEFYFETIIR